MSHPRKTLGARRRYPTTPATATIDTSTPSPTRFKPPSLIHAPNGQTNNQSNSQSNNQQNGSLRRSNRDSSINAAAARQSLDRQIAAATKPPRSSNGQSKQSNNQTNNQSTDQSPPHSTEKVAAFYDVDQISDSNDHSNNDQSKNQSNYQTAHSVNRLFEPFKSADDDDDDDDDELLSQSISRTVIQTPNQPVEQSNNESLSQASQSSTSSAPTRYTLRQRMSKTPSPDAVTQSKTDDTIEQSETVSQNEPQTDQVENTSQTKSKVRAKKQVVTPSPHQWVSLIGARRSATIEDTRIQTALPPARSRLVSAKPGARTSVTQNSQTIKPSSKQPVIQSPIADAEDDTLIEPIKQPAKQTTKQENQPVQKPINQPIKRSRTLSSTPPPVISDSSNESKQAQTIKEPNNQSIKRSRKQSSSLSPTTSDSSTEAKQPEEIKEPTKQSNNQTIKRARKQPSPPLVANNDSSNESKQAETIKEPSNQSIKRSRKQSSTLSPTTSDSSSESKQPEPIEEPIKQSTSRSKKRTRNDSDTDASGSSQNNLSKTNSESDNQSSQSIALSRPRRARANWPINYSDAMVEEDPLTFIEMDWYADPEDQPFQVSIHPSVNVLMDVHAHLSHDEIIGILGGEFDEESRTLRIHSAYPCASLVDESVNSRVNVEVDPISICDVGIKIEERGLKICGWYHSHPYFRNTPSMIDVQNQTKYQDQFSPTLALAKNSATMPFVGAIITPYGKGTFKPSPSEVKWFWTERSQPNAPKKFREEETTWKPMDLFVSIADSKTCKKWSVATEPTPSLQQRALDLITHFAHQTVAERVDFSAEWKLAQSDDDEEEDGSVIDRYEQFRRSLDEHCKQLPVARASQRTAFVNACIDAVRNWTAETKKTTTKKKAAKRIR